MAGDHIHQLASTSAMVAFPTSMVMTTGFQISDDNLLEVVKDAKEYVDQAVEEFYFHRCLCSYCLMTYEANLEITYECPCCGARDYKIIEEVKRNVIKPDEKITGARQDHSAA